MWNRIKQLFGAEGRSRPRREVPAISVIPADENKWGVPLLNVSPVTLTMLSTSSDPTCASNALSFGNDDGTDFIGQLPPSTRSIGTDLRYCFDRVLADGALFLPRAMEHKWALFHHQGTITCIRSWRRKVQALARVEIVDGHVAVREIVGTFTDDDEPPEFTTRYFDYLIRSHALGMFWPAPLPAGMFTNSEQAALWCMSMFGNIAQCATEDVIPTPPPEEPLRTLSLLHVAIARNDRAGVERQLDAGIPADLLAADGLAPLHWAMSNKEPDLVDLLLERGANIDVCSLQDTTPLMFATQTSSYDRAKQLLERGANPNAVDKHGYTALHRAAKAGLVDFAELLLTHGASPSPMAHGKTPLAIAKSKGHTALIELLEKATLN